MCVCVSVLSVRVRLLISWSSDQYGAFLYHIPSHCHTSSRAHTNMAGLSHILFFFEKQHCDKRWGLIYLSWVSHSDLIWRCTIGVLHYRRVQKDLTAPNTLSRAIHNPGYCIWNLIIYVLDEAVTHVSSFECVYSYNTPVPDQNQVPVQYLTFTRSMKLSDSCIDFFCAPVTW